MITDESVERVREGADIVQIISEHVKLKRVGNSYRGPCPFHQGTGPNFSVMPSKKLYHCFVCHESGDVFTYLQKRLGMEFPDAIRYVAHRSGIVIEEVQRRADARDPRQPLWDVNAMVADWFRTQLWDESTGEEARNYLAFRRISRDVADRFELGFAPRDADAMRAHLVALGTSEETLIEAGLLVKRDDSEELRPRFRNRLIFPILDQSGNCTGFGGRLLGPGEPKYLNSAESPVYSKGRLLYGLHMAKHAIRRESRVMIVEGYFDVVRLVSAGFEWVVAPLGTALTEDQAAMLPRYAKQAFLLYDNDKAGLKASFRSGDQLLRQRMSVQIVTLPEGEDPDSFVDKFGAEKLLEHINGSVDVFERKLRELQRTGYFSDLRKRRVAVDKLLPTIRAATDLVTRELYLTMAAEVSGVPREALMREVEGAPQLTLVRSTSAPNSPYPSNDIEELPSSVASSSFDDRYAESEDFDRERPLIRILLHVRSRIEHVVETIGPEDLRDPALKDIYRALLAVPAEAPLEEVANRLNRKSLYCFEELQGDPIGNGEEIDSQIEGSIAKILDAALGREIAETRRQLSIATETEKDHLLQRLVELKKQRRELHANRSVRPAIRQS